MTSHIRLEFSRRLARTPLHALALGVTLALTHWGLGLGANTARADSAIGVDTALGNAMNPPGRTFVPRALANDADDAVRRSPSGQLYGIPAERPAERSKLGAWDYTLNADIGLLGGDAGQRNALFGKYKDVKKGLLLDYVEAEADKVESGHYLQFVAGGAGRQDQFYGLNAGRYNDWKVRIFYNETRHVFTDTYKPAFEGTGSGNLTLAGGLKPMGGAVAVTTGSPTVGTGACTVAAPCWRYTGADAVTKVYSNATALVGINWTGGAVVAAGTAISPNSIAGSINRALDGVAGDTELGLLRKKAGAMAEAWFSDHWKGYAGYSHEHRTGARPFSMNENNYTVEIPEPIDYTTHDVLAGLSYTDSMTQANLRTSASVFHNGISSLTVQQPWLAAATGLAAAQTTVFDLYPDNSALNLKGEFARNLPSFFKGRFTATAGWSSSRQNDTLMMPMDPTQSAQINSALGTSIIPGINNPGYATNTLNLGNWDGTKGSPLSQSTARQRIDTRLVNVALALRPLDGLGLKGEIRHHATDNQGGYTAYNPLTGQFGRGFRNSSAFDLVVGSSGAPGAIGVPCHAPFGAAAVAACVFNGNAGVAGQGTNNPANVPVFSPPRDVKQTNFSFSADQEMGRSSSINLAVEREEIQRTFRERDKTWDDKFKLGYVNRGIEDATLRLSYEQGQRRGSAYEFWPVGDFGTGLPGLDWNTIVTQYLKPATAAPGWTVAPANLSGYLARYAYDSRKYDQADRNQQVLNGRLNLMARDDLDLGVSAQHKNIRYPHSGYGLERDEQGSINLDANYQPSVDQQFYGYYSWQYGNKSMRGNSGTNAAGANNTCTFTTGAALSTEQVVQQCANLVWLPASVWKIDSRDKTEVFGLGYQTQLGAIKLGLDYVHTLSRSSVNYDYGANVLTAAQALAAASAFPTMTLVQKTLTAQLLVPINKRTAARFMFRHESGRVTDWHYDGTPVGASAAEGNATLLLDAGPQGYHSNIVGVFLQVKL